MEVKVNNKKFDVEYVEPTELAGKTVVLKPLKKAFYSEPYHFKITSVGSLGYEYSFLLTLSNAFNIKELIFVEYLARYMDKNNIVSIDKDKLTKELDISERTLYRWIKSLLKEDFLVKVSKNKYMLNPQIIINYRKVKNWKIPELVENYRQYKYVLNKKEKK